MWDSDRVPDRTAVLLTSDGEMLLLRPWPPVACVATATATAAATGLSPMIQSPMSSASTPTAVARPAGRYAVYVAAVPLRAPQGPAQALMSWSYSLGLWDVQHFMVLLRPDPARTQTPTQEQESSLVFDFQPRDPEDALAAFSVLSRSKIPGVVRRRTLRRIPDRRSWFVGLSDGDAADAAERFSERWPTDLVVGNHDCRDYTNGLVEVLTGQKRVLDSLRSAGRQ